MLLMEVVAYVLSFVFIFFVKQKTAYEMRISDWSSDVCSSDLEEPIVSISTTSPVIETHPFRYRVGLRTNNSSPIMNLGLVIIKRLGVSHHRSEERRVGKECVSTCRSRWSP